MPARVLQLLPDSFINSLHSGDREWYYSNGLEFEGFAHCLKEGCMKKQVNVRSIKLLSLAIGAAVTIIFGANISASAQDKPKFKVGDRIECDNSGSGKYWDKGTVVPFLEHDLYNGNTPESGYFYRVKLDGSSGSPGSKLCKAETMRPLAGTTDGRNDAANKNADSKTDNQADTNPLAQDKNGAVECPAADPDSNGEGALEQSFRGAIRRDFEKAADPGQDGRVTVTVQSVSIGQAHPYRAYIDPNEAQGKTIYPIRATFTACTDYNTRIYLIKRQRAFACYKNTAGEWVCDIFATPNAAAKDETKSIDKPRQ
jgi:hypothetical protein